eukprot:UN31949
MHVSKLRDDFESEDNSDEVKSNTYFNAYLSNREEVVDMIERREGEIDPRSVPKQPIISSNIGAKYDEENNFSMMRSKQKNNNPEIKEFMTRKEREHKFITNIAIQTPDYQSVSHSRSITASSTITTQHFQSTFHNNSVNHPHGANISEILIKALNWPAHRKKILQSAGFHECLVNDSNEKMIVFKNGEALLFQGIP